MKAIPDEIPQVDLIKVMGLSRNTLAEWARRPGCPRVQRAGKWLYQWPAFREWYIGERIAAGSGQGKPSDLEEAKMRKLSAEAELAELELAKARGEVVPVARVREAALADHSRVRARLRDLPVRAVQAIAGKQTKAQQRAALEALVEEALGELRDMDVPDDDDMAEAA